MHRHIVDAWREAFTLVEMLVVISIVVLLVALLLPALGGARAQASTTACMATQRQLGVGLHAYAADYKNEAVPGWSAHYDPAFYYTKACDDRAGNWMTYGFEPGFIPAGLGLIQMSKLGYLPDLRTYYCSAAPKELPGAYDTQNWGPNAYAVNWGGWDYGQVKIKTLTGFVISSYYYRYAGGSDPIGAIVPAQGGADPIPFNEVNRYRSRIDDLLENCPAALFDGVRDAPRHPGGFNVLGYNGAVRFLRETDPNWNWGWQNVFSDWTDCWGNGSPIFWDAADELF